VTGFVHEHFSDRNGFTLGREATGNAVAVKVDQVPAVRTLGNQVAVHTFGF